MLASIKKDANERMKKSLDTLRAELAKIRTGRAHPSLLEHIHVDYYGSEVPLSQAASVSIEDPRTLTVNPWDKSMVGKIENPDLRPGSEPGHRRHRDPGAAAGADRGAPRRAEQGGAPRRRTDQDRQTSAATATTRSRNCSSPRTSPRTTSVGPRPRSSSSPTRAWSAWMKWSRRRKKN